MIATGALNARVLSRLVENRVCFVQFGQDAKVSRGRSFKWTRGFPGSAAGSGILEKRPMGWLAVTIASRSQKQCGSVARARSSC